MRKTSYLINKQSKRILLQKWFASMLTVCLFFCSLTICAQSKSITGVVTDASGESLIGASVIVKGTTNGTVTNLDGRFTLNEVRPASVLVISYVGYLTQEVTVGDQRTINVQLREDTQRLDEVVVVGYGTQAKKDITGSVAVVDTRELLKATGSSAGQQLQGKAAGVYVGTSGAPGSQTMVRIRGINSINDNGPLFVIDGVSTRNQDLSTINPNDIESLQVLKDASSAAIYGAQASNGVILITTKKGTKSGTPVLRYDGYFGVQNTTKRYDVLSGQERLDIEWNAMLSAVELGALKEANHSQFGKGSTYTIPNYMTVNGAGGKTNIDPSDYSYPNNVYVPFSNTNWWDELDRTGTIQNHQLSLSGGSDKGTYNMSLNYFGQTGTQIYTYYNRYQIRANTSYNIRPWLRIGENITYAYTKDLGRDPNGSEASLYSWTYRASPWVPVYDIMGNFAGSRINGTGNWQNPVAIRTRDKDNYWTNNRFFGNAWAEIDLIKGMTVRTLFGVDVRNNYSYRMSKKNLEFSESPGTNDLEEAAGVNIRYQWTNTLTYSRTFADVHKLTAQVGTEFIRDNLGKGMNARRYNYAFEDNPDTWTLAMGEMNNQRTNNSWFQGEMALFGVFGRADYSYQDKYLFTGIIRRDGVSRFAPKNRYAMFPSVSLGWRISQESFMESTRSWLDDLKIRIGYGETGSSDIPRTTNFAYEFVSEANRSNYDLSGTNTSGTPGYRLSKLGNEDTKWEAVASYNVGFDATLLDGKFGVGIEWYRKTTTNMLINAPYSATKGEADAPYINFGSMRNTGVDMNFNYRDKIGDFAWDISLNLSTYKNEIIQLSPQAADYSLWGNGARLAQSITRSTAGHPISMFYGFVVNGFYENEQEVMALPPLGTDIKNAAEAKRWVGKFKFADLDGKDGLTLDDRTFIGNPHPDLVAGLNIGLTYKSFDLTAFFYSNIGNDLFNNTKYFTDFWLFGGNRSTRMRDQSWKPGKTDAILPILDYTDTYSGTNPSTYYVEDGSFVKLKNLVIGYTLPKALLKKATIQDLRIYLQTENLFTLTRYSGLDPEFGNAEVGAGNESDRRRGLDMGAWPTVRSIIFGVNFTF